MSKSWTELSVSNLRHNLSLIRSKVGPKVAIMPVVKANAYGHGIEHLAQLLLDEGINRFAVAHLEEALQLRALSSRPQILVLEGCPSKTEKIFQENNLTASWFEPRPVPNNLKFEVQTDTGMGRLGLPWDSLQNFLQTITNTPQGIFSHLARADSDSEFTRLQLKRFLKSTQGITCRRHLCNSAGLLFREAYLDQVRPGIALYGIPPCRGFDDFKPVLTWKTQLLSVRQLKAGEWLGYGSSYQSSRDSTIGIMSVGYADGYRRHFSNRGKVLIKGQLSPVVGLVTMDMTCVDLTGLKDVAPGDNVTVMSNDLESPLSCPELAVLADTNPHEILTGIGPRVHRILVD
jgi:alanine racemase